MNIKLLGLRVGNISRVQFGRVVRGLAGSENVDIQTELSSTLIISKKLYGSRGPDFFVLSETAAF